VVADLSAEEGIDWITALQAPQIASLLDRGELPASLFDERDLADKGGNQNSVPCIPLYPPPVILSLGALMKTSGLTQQMGCA
jgi:hypothetical protein